MNYMDRLKAALASENESSEVLNRNSVDTIERCNRMMLLYGNSEWRVCIVSMVTNVWNETR